MLFLALGALISSSYAAQLPLDTELIVNGGFETGDTSGWSAGPNATVDFYGSSEVPFSVSGPIGGGAWYMTSAGNFASLTQSIDLSGNIGDIDSVGTDVVISANVGGLGNSGAARGILTVRCLDANGALTETLSIGDDVGPDARNDVTNLLARSARLLIPVGTRTLSVQLTAANGASYADNASVLLSTSVPPSPLPYGAELLVNGDFETGSVSGQPSDGWTISEAPVITRPYGAFNAPAFSFSSIIQGGSFCFGGTGNNGLTNRRVSQRLNLSANIADVDAGALELDFSAYVGGIQGNGTSVRVGVRFIGSLGQVFAESQLPDTSSLERQSESVLFKERLTVPVPVLTRQIEIYATFVRSSGQPSGLIDNVSARLDFAQPDPPVPYDQPLIADGDFESGEFRAFNDPVRWRPLGGRNFAIRTYGLCCGLTAADVAAWNGGDFVAGAPSTQSGRASLIVDVAANAADIDAGIVRLVVRGDFGAVGNSFDLSSLTALPTNTFGQALDSFRIGEVTREERNFQTVLLRREGAYLLPPGTRSIEFQLSATIGNPTQNTSRGLIDNISAEITTGIPEVQLGTRYCSPVAPNSTGFPGRMTGFGSPFLEDNSMAIVASDLPPNGFGFFLTSMTQGFTAAPGGSQGNLCLDGAIGRYIGSGQILNSGAGGSFSLNINLATMPTPSGTAPVMAGQTWNFQAWHRDNNPGATSNFTDGLAISF